ncbi:glycosyltransferase family 2 protein [Oscillatoria sp. FACHB-1407]|uniref:glycosyltransferase family 2 protein n=1 Tax=Oscillatoria sp. FACHB-1407 TaxID=2692847 RepID=UPI001688BE99|nr:glycosyltransferase family 2 protein [Oscillatoria sp. FACHB-1407]MBD2463989.1 glycosyltransferase family 2 protein [Oscillatoria sp. FACHB-1407]
MLSFVIPLQSPKVSKSWDTVTLLFERTLRSLCSQTSPNFNIVVACHERPEIGFHHPNITYINVDFPVPAADVRFEKVRDRMKKHLTALEYALRSHPTHVMKVDADDLVSRHLAAYVDQHPNANGWYMRQGYLYEEGSQQIYLARNDFYKRCGSCNILRADLARVPEDLHDPTLDFASYYTKHSTVMKLLAHQGNPLEPLPFAGALYTYAHGENASGNRNKPTTGHVLRRVKTFFVNFRPLTPSIREEFGLSTLPVLAQPPQLATPTK